VELKILPLAVTMMAGPQILSAIIFVTHERAVRVSLAFVSGVLVATTLGVAVTRGLAALVGEATSLGRPSDEGSTGSIIQYALVGLLVLAAVRTYLGRETAEPPKWLGRMQTADEKRAFVAALLLILVFPSDVLVLLTVGANLEQNDASLLEALPFIALTVLIAAVPFLAYLLFRRRAVSVMPRVRDWMNSHSWVVNIGVCVLFIVLILG
jgi:threonine/homoserine/homoserine lactone efflux protein